MSFKSLFATAGMAACLVAGLTHATEMKSGNANPLLAPWTGPFGGVPPFDQAKVEHLKPGLEAGMAEQLAEIDRITRRVPRQPPAAGNACAGPAGGNDFDTSEFCLDAREHAADLRTKARARRTVARLRDRHPGHCQSEHCGGES